VVSIAAFQLRKETDNFCSPRPYNHHTVL
jgi:hypothetical protein